MSPSPQAMTDSIKSNSATGAAFQGKFVSALLTFKKKKQTKAVTSISGFPLSCRQFHFLNFPLPKWFGSKFAEAELLKDAVQRLWVASDARRAHGAHQSVSHRCTPGLQDSCSRRPVSTSCCSALWEAFTFCSDPLFTQFLNNDVLHI